MYHDSKWFFFLFWLLIFQLPLKRVSIELNITPTNAEFHSTEIIIDTSDASEEGLDALKAAAANRMGFDAQSVLTSAGLADKVVAGNFFNVTNPGPLPPSPTSNSTSSGGDGTNPKTSPSPVPTSAAAVSQSVSASLLASLMVGVAFVAL